MRVLVKGGVWKNSEDEILKAGIMKYGKNEWARVATLLPRKTAKQCKARWFEWLDPTIRKVSWTRQEDEKLLHLAKLLPTQWRTIAPILGRTPGQCLERYGELLDKASGVDPEESEEARKTRVGDIDVNPEAKPARPDSVDLDPEEADMLAEAKGRLSNISGKKAKRKAREKLLANSRRMSRLENFRQNKAAGVASSIASIMKKGKNELDYINEIPFERTVPTGYYDVSKEKTEGLNRLRDASNKRALLKRANEDPNKRAKREQDSMKRDRERFEKLAKENLEEAMKEIEERNSGAAATYRKRSKMVLPEPQVTDNELEEIAKFGRKTRAAMSADSLSSTQILLGDYSESTRTLVRTGLVRTPVAPDVVMEEAKNQRLRQAQATPLVGGQSAVGVTGGTGFAGTAPSVRSAVTPSIAKASVASISGISTVRDHFSLNDEDELMSEAIVSREEAKERKKETIQKLRKGLASLPEPKYSYEVSVKGVDDDGDDDDEEDGKRPKDAADVAAFQRLKEVAKQQAILNNRSKVRKLGLPVPTHVNIGAAYNSGVIFEEMKRIIQDDVNEKENPLMKDAAIETEAQRIIREEAARMFGQDYQAPSDDAISEIWKQETGLCQLVPSKAEEKEIGRKKKKKTVVYHGPFQPVPVSKLTKAQNEMIARMEFQVVEAKIAEVSKLLKKTQSKGGKLIFGLQSRADKAVDGFIKTQQSLQTAWRNNETFKYMRDKELEGIPHRQRDWNQRLERMSKAELDMQAKYYQQL